MAGAWARPGGFTLYGAADDKSMLFDSAAAQLHLLATPALRAVAGQRIYPAKFLSL